MGTPLDFPLIKACAEQLCDSQDAWSMISLLYPEFRTWLCNMKLLRSNIKLLHCKCVWTQTEMMPLWCWLLDQRKWFPLCPTERTILKHQRYNFLLVKLTYWRIYGHYTLSLIMMEYFRKLCDIWSQMFYQCRWGIKLLLNIFAVYMCQTLAANVVSCKTRIWIARKTKSTLGLHMEWNTFFPHARTNRLKKTFAPLAIKYTNNIWIA